MAPQTQLPNAYCPPGWVMNDRSCYLLHTDSPYTWKDANSFCATQLAHLVIIETAEEDNFLKQLTLPIIDLHHTQASGLWTAGSDDDTEGIWKWIDGFRHTDKLIQGYKNWHSGEPDSGSGNHDEDCMCIIGRRNFEWQDYRCSTHMNFICEKSITYSSALVG
ncbi:asialoglycoprotein receptor 1-like [Ruditapes philippinarum]|uniref:asialoglycoprotein receptor 1-like n=1 Tax=Ruditapes philippinarum TaxID=129788 RepID=UPI00295AECC2|nr:asialoglycoprotein receptor 1-like [Ruditapes philippinarum]